MAKSSFRALLLATLLVWSAATQAAGLGKLTVLSNLGQPLRAEIDVVSVEKGELDTLTARLASIDAYLQNNLPYPSPSLGLKLALEKRPSGDPYIRATTIQPVNEPFVDILVELTWNGGRILRAYTALLDPPTYAMEEPAAAAAPAAAAPAAAAPAAAEAAPAPEAAPEPQVQTQMGSEFQQAKPEAEEAMPEMAAATPGEAAAPAGAPALAPAPAPAARPAEAGMPSKPRPATARPMAAEETYGPVKYGDTLSKIARQYKPDGITLEQMLVVMFRNNPEAFSGGNMNRLKTGKVLTVPDESALEALDPTQARQEVRMQTADWNAYKERLAAAAGTGAAMPEQAGQAAGGQVSAMVQDKGPGATGQPTEVLKLSKGAAAGAAAQERIRSLEEEVAARDRTISEQRERVAKLEKTIKDMQALMEIKSKQGADLQKPAMPAPAGAATSAAPPPPPPPAPAPTQPEMPAMAAAPTDTPPATGAGTPGMSMPASAPAAATTAQAAPKPRKPKVVAPPPPAPSLVDQVLGEPMYLGAGAAVLALVGFLGFRMVRKRREAGEDFEVEAEKKNSEVAPLTATDTGGGIAAAARAAAAAAGPVTEEVDPLAEAEIYLAYGRDAQAEEILKEALASNPRRPEVQLKLLEIYAKRKDAAAFEPVARELQGATGGKGEIWQQAVRLGYQVDPGNSRYAAGKPSGAEAAAATAAAGGGLEERLDFNIGLDDADVGTKTDIDLSRLAAPGGGTTTDIDLSSLGSVDESAPDIDLSTIAGVPERTVQVPDVDFDIQGDAAATGTSNVVDFDFDLSSTATAQPTSTQILEKTPSRPAASETDTGGVEFDLSKISLDMGDAGKLEPTMEMGTASGGPDIDLSAINLDLGGGVPEGGEEAKDDRWYDVQTKFDLAKAYQEMGDKEGAREILREVMAEGDPDQKAAAQRVLETIA